MAARPALKRFGRDERGATAIEYAMLIAVLGLGIVTAASGLKDKIYNTLNDVMTVVDDAN